MEETVVLKLKTYNDLKQQIAFLEEGMMGALNTSIEANERHEKKLKGFNRIIRYYIRENTYSNNYKEMYESEKDACIKDGIMQEVDALRIEMMNEKIAEQEVRELEASVDAEMELSK